MRYVVSQKALEAIERECRSQPETETGGIIVGYRDVNLVTITHATGPGINGERSAQHFVKDTEYLQSVLNLLFQYFQVMLLASVPCFLCHPSDPACVFIEVFPPLIKRHHITFLRHS